MIRVSFTFFACVGIVAGLLAGGSVGCSKDDDKGTPAKVLPNPNTERADAANPNNYDDCEPEEDCTGAVSCMGNCGLHELGDRACTCTANAFSCTECALNAQFRPIVQPAATAFCPAGTDDDDPCTTKGEVCIDISYNNAGVGRRDGCLCWQGLTRLEWDCSQNVNAFFQDMAPPTPPRPDAGMREGGVNPPPPPATDAGATPVDAPVTTD
jgi:hypothetical protein